MKNKKKHGSALIMTIVLTSLLAIVAVMFVAVARMDRASTSNIADNKTLDLAAKSIVEIISKELILDTPGVAKGAVYPKATYPQYYDYQDYPDANDAWLASIEPYLVSGKSPGDSNYGAYRWRQISDVTGFIKNEFGNNEVNDVPVRPTSSTVIREYPDIVLSPTTGKLVENKSWADADGDGIADSKWIELENLHSSKGKAIYAAVRVIDNGGMVNVNTAHTFNPDSAVESEIDGTSQMQINLKGLLKTGDTIDNLHNTRCGAEVPSNWTKYEKNVIWDYNTVPDGNYLPFDISDELELRYRYCIDSKFISRFEDELPETPATTGWDNFGHLYDGRSEWGLADDWQPRITNPDDPNTDRRHMLTTVNFDRVITPGGYKMTNINYADVNSLYTAVRSGILDANSSFPDVNGVSAQIAVNIKDYRDGDSNVAVFRVDDVNYYGFERPCVYISELACRIGLNDVNTSYAIELFKPYADKDPNGWKLLIDSNTYNIDWSGNRQFHVIAWQDSNCPLFINPAASIQDYNNSDSNTIFSANDTISLIRDVNGVPVVVDSVVVPAGWSPVADGNYSVQRDITQNKCILRLWGSVDADSSTLGVINDYNSPDANMIQAHPADANFTNVGQIGMIFRKAAYYKPNDPCTNVIGYDDPNKLESAVRLNLADPNFQHIFKYLTVMDPNKYVSDANETRIKGRININTAPAYVIAQLPWVAHRKNYDSNDLAKAIVAYRDKMKESESDPNYDYEDRVGAAGFETIGQLCNVNFGSDPNFGIDYYKRDSINQIGFPDIDKPTERDTVADDFEERDLIFARISDLVTVRSDVFTAYILVRVCNNITKKKIDNVWVDVAEGPQKRYMVIFDRSQTTKDNKKVKIIAFQSVPEAR